MSEEDSGSSKDEEADLKEMRSLYYEQLAVELAKLPKMQLEPLTKFSVTYDKFYVYPYGVEPVKGGALEKMMTEYLKAKKSITPLEEFEQKRAEMFKLDYSKESIEKIFRPDFDSLRRNKIRIVPYSGEHELKGIMNLVGNNLSEPYSIYTYRYFLHCWPQLCFVAYAEDRTDCIGAILCKMSILNGPEKQGYIAMLVVDKPYRRMRVARNLVLHSLSSMLKEGCIEVVLETEVNNYAALNLYSGLYFYRNTRWSKYYLNGMDAFSLKLCFTPPGRRAP